MQQYLDGDTLYANMMMLRTVDDRAILILEGWSDCSALDPHVAEGRCQTLPAHSRRAVERAIELVDLNQTPLVLGVVDRDWVGVLDPPHTSKNVVCTDLYDLDTTILLSGDVAPRVIAVFTDRSAVSAHVTACACASPLAVALRIAVVIGSLRLISLRDGLDLSTRQLPVEATLAPSGDEIDYKKLATVVASRSPRSSMTAADIEDVLISQLPLAEEASRLCSGHDMAAVLAWLMRQKWGGGAVGYKNVAATIRAALSCETLKATSLYADVKAWAASNGTVVWSCV